MLDPFSKEKKVHSDIMNNMLSDVHTSFKEYVITNRKRMDPNFEATEDMFDGRA